MAVIRRLVPVAFVCVLLAAGLSTCDTAEPSAPAGSSTTGAASISSSAAPSASADGPEAVEPESESAVPEVSASSTEMGEPSPLAEEKPKSYVEPYAVTFGTGSLRLRAAPNTNAEILDVMYQSPNYFYPFLEQDGWYYGVYTGQAGWCSAEYLTLINYGDDEFYSYLPEFLTAEQQCTYLRACTLAGGMPWGSIWMDQTQVTIDGETCTPCSYFLGEYERMEACVKDLFDGPVQEYFLTQRFKNLNGTLYEPLDEEEINYLGMDLQSSEVQLVSKTDTQIQFTVIGHYVHPGNGVNLTDIEYTREWPISMELGSDGVWRFTQFATLTQGPME